MRLAASDLHDVGDDLFAVPSVALQSQPDGTLHVYSTVALDDGARCVGDWLERWGRERPDGLFLAERRRADAPWTELTYGAALAKVRAAASWMLAAGMDGQRPLAVLSDNGIDHAILSLAAMHVGVPVASISPAYSLISKDFEKLSAAIKLLDPGAIYVTNVATFGAALAAIRPLHSGVIIAGGEASDQGAIAIADVLAIPPSAQMEDRFAAITQQTVAKLLFTSGSTGLPKAVINTQRMLTSSQQAKAQVWPFLDRMTEPLVLLDWLPWSHTFGANHNFNMVLRNGGSLYIDGGKPAPGLFDISLANLRSVIPTVYFNVPKGFDMLVSALRADAALRQRFFQNVKCLFFAGAALPQNLWEAIEDLSVRTVGRAIPMVSAWGSTETSPLATDCHFRAERSGNIGVPIPGTTLKLVRAGEKLEVRVRGPNVTPGYWKAPELTAKAFDDDGFYLIGDAVRFADVERPDLGLLFDGRIAEDFKLISGTWVNVGNLRVAGIAALAPLVQDIVVAGHGGDEVRFLLIPNVEACRAVADVAVGTPTRDILQHDKVRAAVANGLSGLRASGIGSSTYATRALFLAEPPSVDGGEVTDKGYINQRAMLARRIGDLAKLNGDDETIWIGLATPENNS